MDFVRYFFRGNPDGGIFPGFSPLHGLIIAITGMVIYYIYTNKNKLQQRAGRSCWPIIMASALLLQQGILYAWYGFSGYFTLQEGLPLYNCRVAILCTGIALLTGNKTLKTIGVYWGVIGATLALLVPEIDPFSFPHFTNFSFILGHMILLWSNLYLVWVENFKFDRVSLQTILWFTNLYHIVLCLFDRVTGSNYCYLVHPPFAGDFFMSHLSVLGYSMIIMALFNLVMILVYYTGKAVQGQGLEKIRVQVES